MKISEIVISNYRAFYNEKGEENTKYRIGLKPGKNLLIYGENGSGKSSLYKGLQELFHSSDENNASQIIPNVFSRDQELDEQPYVEVTFSENDMEDETFRLSSDPARTINDSDLLRNTIRTRSFMTYRDLLRVHFIPDPEINLFSFLFGTEGLLAELRNPSISRPETDVKMGVLLQAVRANPDEINVSDFVNGVNQILTDLSSNLNCLLNYFDHSLSVAFSTLTKEQIEQGNPVIKTEVIYSGINLSAEAEQYHHFLNEARLSALAICIFLSAHLSIPAAPYQLLFLDDIFTGLDTSNRIPLLEILSDEIIVGTESETFTKHQIILTTYDRHWYELAKNHLAESRWSFLEMFIDRHSKGFDHPALVPAESDFEKAQHYFRMKQYPACANYQRKICENLIKKFLPDHKKYQALPNGDIKPIDKLATLIDQFESYLTEQGLDFSPYIGLKTCLRAFMNPLSHDDGESPAYRRELELGFSLLRKLNSLRNTEIIKQGDIIHTQQTDQDSGVGYLYEFELQTSIRLITTESGSKINKVIIRPLRMIRLDTNKITTLGYEPESIEKSLKSVVERLKIKDTLDPMNEFKWRNGGTDEPLSSIIKV